MSKSAFSVDLTEYKLAFIALIWVLQVLSNLQADFQQNLSFQSFCLGINQNAQELSAVSSTSELSLRVRRSKYRSVSPIVHIGKTRVVRIRSAQVMII